MTSPRPKISTLSFEVALKELETIVAQMERGSVELEQAIELYTRGTALKEHCEKKLSEAKLKVEKLTLSPQGVASSEAFDAE